MGRCVTDEKLLRPTCQHEFVALGRFAILRYKVNLEARFLEDHEWHSGFCALSALKLRESIEFLFPSAKHTGGVMTVVRHEYDDAGRGRGRTGGHCADAALQRTG